MSEPAYVCMECARTTSGRCVQHSYVPMPKQDILSECGALRKRVENRLRIAVNESCSCGGREPGPEACPACMVWHRMNDGADCEPKAKLPLGHPYSVFVDGDDGRPCTATVGSKGMLWPCGQPRSAHEPM